MRAVVKVKQSQGRGPSNAARYIAESKIDPEHEGKGSRPLFTNRGDNDLKYGDANRYLNGGRGRPAKGDLIHFSVSFRNEDFERLGATNDERKEGLREAAREAMDELKSELRVADWRWVAGIHLNTKHPHIHFLIYKEITNDKEKRQRLGKIPKRLLPRRDHSSTGETRPVEGVIGSYFVEALDRAAERAREVDSERQEASTKMTNERLEAGSEINKESAHPSSKLLAEPDPHDHSGAGKTAGQVHAIRIVNRKHFKGEGGDNEVYVGRATAGTKGSVLGNPYRIGRDGAREEVIEKYGQWLSWEIAERGDAYRELQRLAEIARTGELVLVCWCAPEKCHGEVIKSEIESINDLRNREPETPDMSEILSHSLEFDTPLVHQGIEYHTVENFYQAMKTAKEDLETRRKIAAATPDEARRLGAQIQARPDWPEIRREVLETALRHKFAPSTRWHTRLRSTGNREITDGSKDNILGRLLMDIRDEFRRRRPATFLDRLSGETRSWLTLEVMPAIERLLEVGKTRQEIFTEIDRQVYRRRLPSGARERSKEMAERAMINDFLKARVDLRLYSDDRLLELAERNPSPAGRELTRELILRGPRQRFGGEPDVRSDLREAFRDRHLSVTGYETQHGKSGWLGRHSSDLRRMYEGGAVIKDDILVIPAEPHELNGVVNDRKPFMNELRYAHERISDPGKANEFHTLGKAIAGRTANAKAEIAFFKYYYGLISREKGDEQGRLLGKGESEAREEALDITLNRMRELAPVMEQEESRVSIEAQRPSLVASLEEIREAQASALYDDEQEHVPEPADVEAIEESNPDLDEPEATEREPEIGSFIFNTSARFVNLNDESLRFPGGLNLKDRKDLVGVHMPNIDAKLESGMAPKTILSGIDEMVEERNRNLPEDLTTKQRERAVAKNQSAGAFLKNYVAERLKDPETRALNRSEVFREAHARITESRTPDELNRAADAIRGDNRLNERDRKLLFFGRAPDQHSPEMRELRRMWWLPQTERVKALSSGGLTPAPEPKELTAATWDLHVKDHTHFAPAPQLKELIAELDSRNSEGRVDYFFSALKNPPEKMHKPEESVRLGLWPKSQALLSHERAYLLDLTWEKKQSFAGRYPSLRETAPRIEEIPPSRDGESLRIYLAVLKDREQSLLEARQPVSQEERIAIHDKACRQAWDRLALPEVFAERPTDAARALSDTIAELHEKVQPQARLAAQVLNEFSVQKTGHPHDRIPQESLARLSPSDLGKLNELERFAAAARDELYRGFERIDLLRFEIEMSREAGNAANVSREQATPAGREPGATDGVAAKEASGQQTPPPAGRSFGEPPRESRSYREYTAAVTEIERRLLDEAIRQNQPADKGGQEIASADGLLSREEKLRIRITAAGLAWERIEPREIFTNDPAVIELLSLSEAVARLRDEAQPRAREAAGKLDEFIRSRDLDRFAAEKTDYYYRADQIPKDELEKLSPADKLEFAALERRAGATLREFKERFGAIDKIRTEIDQARNGARSPAAPGGASGIESKVQHIDRAGSQGNRVEAPIPDPGRERMNDRIILGRCVIAHARADSTALDYEIARDHGRAFRFNVRDESVEANRRISDLDVRRRAGARGDRAADERGAERKDDRLALRGQVSEVDIRHHSTTLEEHGKKLGGLVNQLETRAKNALDAYQHSRRLAGEVVEKYQKRGEAPPAPLVERETLAKTQAEAIERRLAGHAERLERLRVALAEEHGQPLRDDREAARLAAQLFTARIELQAREERATRFDETRHLRQWEIRGEKLSLADIDRMIEQATDKAQFVGKREFHIFPDDRRQASAEVERLGGTRQEVVEKTGEQQDDLRKSVSEAGKLLDTLTRAYERETALREQAGLVMPDPQFTRQELERAADNIETARDAAALRRLSVFERQFNTYADPKERINPAEGWGRAPGRALVAEIFHRESSERLTAFRERGSLQPLLIETSGGLVTHRFKDTEPRSLIELLARPIVETPAQREVRHGAQAAFAHYESRLQADVVKTHAYLEAAREIASSQAAERNLRAGRELPAPDVALTPKQAMIVEIHAERQTDPEDRKRLLSLARGSALSQYDSHSRTNSLDRAAAREVASVIGRGR